MWGLMRGLMRGLGFLAKAPDRPPHLDGLLGRTSPRLVRL